MKTQNSRSDDEKSDMKACDAKEEVVRRSVVSPREEQDCGGAGLHGRAEDEKHGKEGPLIGAICGCENEQYDANGTKSRQKPVGALKNGGREQDKEGDAACGSHFFIIREEEAYRDRDRDGEETGEPVDISECADEVLPVFRGEVGHHEVKPEAVCSGDDGGCGSPGKERQVDISSGKIENGCGERGDEHGEECKEPHAPAGGTAQGFLKVGGEGGRECEICGEDHGEG